VERPGFKSEDADLIGFPIRVTIGEKKPGQRRRRVETARHRQDEAPARGRGGMNPNGIQSLSPALTRSGYAGKTIRQRHNSEGVASVDGYDDSTPLG
jgi:hypothetical protein